MKKKIFGCFLFLIIVYGCSSNSQSSDFTFGTGTYNFKMSDSLGNPIVDGILIVKSNTDNKISGTYEFKNISQKDFPSLTVMDGEFSGDINTKEKRVFINTNPRIADSNVFWYLDFKKSSLSGDWIHSTFRGSSSKGKIKITK